MHALLNVMSTIDYDATSRETDLGYLQECVPVYMRLGIKRIDKLIDGSAPYDAERVFVGRPVMNALVVLLMV